MGVVRQWAAEQHDGHTASPLESVGECEPAVPGADAGGAAAAAAAEHPRGRGLARDACALLAHEFAWVRGSAADEEWARHQQAHKRQGHYETRNRICICLAAGHEGAALASCVVAPDSEARARKRSKEEL